MSALAQAMKEATNGTYTLNGMPVNKSSLNAHVDLFFAFGANRGRTENVLSLFQRAYIENEDLAVRIALYGRDVRGGMGEREHFRQILRDLARTGEYYTVRQLVPFVPVVGRWDDLFALVNTSLEEDALSLYAAALQSGDALAAKWAPREKSANSGWAKALRGFMGLSPRQYRKLLVSSTNVIESDMCAGEWGSINYDHVPSLAAIRYQKAFNKNDSERYQKYLTMVEKGEAKINAGAVYPHQVVQSITRGDERAAEQQWKALPNYIPDGNSFIPMVDVSGSMHQPLSRADTTLAIDVSIALGLYCAMKSKGPFEGKMLTFSQRPSWIDVSGLSLQNAVNKTRRADWGGNTDIEAAYRLILNVAMKNDVPQSDMPDYLIVFSDMQFDNASRGGITADIERGFRDAGYQVPKMVYWNLVDYEQNTHVTFDKKGSALVSGFSPATMKAVLADVESFTPIDVVLEAVMLDRYDWQKNA